MQECLNCVELRKMIKELEDKIFSLEHWKGKDIKSIELEDGVWHIVTHQKSKTSLKVSTIHFNIPNKNVLVMKEKLVMLHHKYAGHQSYVKGCFDGHGKICSELKFELRNHYNTGFVSNQEFFGFRKRYFEYYYYPLVVLAHFGFIEYDSYGSITLKKKIFSNDSVT